MSAPIKTALASYGMSGQVFHMPILRTVPGFEITSVVQRNADTAKQLMPSVRIIRSFDDLLTDNELELILVNTPDHFHFEHAKKALLAGKHIVVEKPFVQTVSQGEELIALASKMNCIITVFQNRRWDNGFLTVKKVLNEGLIGRLVEYEARFDRYRNFVPISWKEDPGTGTGILQNLGSHLIDQALHLFGMPSGVFCNLHAFREGSGVRDYFDVQLFYPDNKSVTLKASYLAREAGPAFLLHGTEGSYIKYGMDPQEDLLKTGAFPEGAEWGKENRSQWGKLNSTISNFHFEGCIESEPGNYNAFYENLYEVIRNNRNLAVPANEALQVIRVIEAAERSYRGKCVVNL
jgi:scyllo-inositol 2-dehydrogenase (NADP+)